MKTIFDWTTNQDSIKLEVCDYEFPGHEYKHDYDYYDCNWLMIQLTKKHNNDLHVSKDPCLMTDDLSKISRWLNNVLRRGEKARSPDFMEPGIELTCSRREGDSFFITVKVGSDFFQSGKSLIEFKLHKADIRQTINNIKICLEKFPIRLKPKGSL